MTRVPARSRQGRRVHRPVSSLAGSASGEPSTTSPGPVGAGHHPIRQFHRRSRRPRWPGQRAAASGEVPSCRAGKSADILANSVEGFIARTPEELLEFLRAQLPDPSTGRPVADAVPKFLATHPAAAGAPPRIRSHHRTDGIDLSEDPVLLARSAAYSLSYERRSRGE